MSAATAPVRYDPEQEIRFAVVMYGGVSLAIYMYGVAEELWHLVRATAPNRPESSAEPPDGLAYPEPESTEGVYRELARMLPLDGPVTPETPVRTRFVVDVISGTSAGGINGICLAKALVNETSLAPLKEVWLNEGDISVLVDDEESALARGDDGTLERIPELLRSGPPLSLLNGRRMLRELVRALAAMNVADGGRFDSRLVEELDLWVTATDLAGLDVSIQLDRGKAVEKRHAHRANFRYSPVDERNDFAADDSPFLAYAARCTSAFPFAFEPMVLQTLEPFAPVDPAWDRFYPTYAAAEPEFGARAFSDGGILDNKPFSHAIETVGKRRATLPVERKLVYIEPDPATLGNEAAKTVWNAIETARAAAMKIPTVETIREDLEQVLGRNRIIERVRDISSRVQHDAQAQGKLTALAAELPDADWARLTLAETIESGRWGPSYGTYHRLKVLGVVDYLTRLLVRAAAFDADSDEVLATTYLVRAWKTRAFDEDPSPGQSSDNAFLVSFDIPYRLRRIGFVLQKLRELASADAALASRALEATPLSATELPYDPGRDAVFAAFRRGLHGIRWELQQVERLAAAPGAPLAKAIEGLRLGRADLEAILDARKDGAMAAVADRLVAAEPQAFDAVVAALAEALGRAARDAGTAVDGLLGAHTSIRSDAAAPDLRSTLAYVLRFYYDAFEAYDLVLYPIQYGSPIGEGNLVDVSRISPLDASSPEVPHPARELKGVSLHHFGAFLDEGWRRNDMVWGRLNAAECLIRTLLPERPEEADSLVARAHDEIVAEYREDLASVAGRDASKHWFESAKTPERVRTIKALGRAAAVVGALVEAILDTRRGVRGLAARRGWRLVRRALDPERRAATAVAAVLKLLWIPLVLPGVLLLAAGLPLWLTGAAETLGVVLTIVGGALLALSVALVGVAVVKLRSFVFSRVYDAVFREKDRS